MAEAYKQKYCNKAFKRQLVKALKTNFCEPNHIDRIRGNRTLQEYSEERIVEFVNSVAGDVQKGIEHEIDDKEAQSTFQLATLVNEISGKKKSQELNMVMKVKSESCDIPSIPYTHNVDFRDLTRFLYASMSGLPNCNSLNKESTQVLLQTHDLLMEQINKDATPEFLNEIKSKICAGGREQPNVGVEDLANAFQDKNLNPFGFPFEFLLKGSLPSKDEPDVDPQPDSTMSHKKDSEDERSATETPQVEDVTSSEKVSPEK